MLHSERPGVTPDFRRLRITFIAHSLIYKVDSNLASEVVSLGISIEGVHSETPKGPKPTFDLEIHVIVHRPVPTKVLQIESAFILSIGQDVSTFSASFSRVDDRIGTGTPPGNCSKDLNCERTNTFDRATRWYYLLKDGFFLILDHHPPGFPCHTTSMTT